MAINLIKINEFPVAETVNPGDLFVVANSNGIARKITEAKLREFLGLDTLLEFKGAVNPSSSAPSGDFWVIATEDGTYTNFNNIVVPANSLAIISRIGGVYSSSITEIDISALLNEIYYVLNYFYKGYKKALFLEEFNAFSPDVVSGIVTTTNGLRATTGYVSKRNYVLGDAKFMEFLLNGTSNVAGDAFVVGIKADNSITVLLSRTAGSTNATIDVSDYERVSFSFAAGSTSQYVKFFSGVEIYSEDNVKKYIDNVKILLDGIVANPIITETVIDSTYVGTERLNNTVLKDNGTTSSSSGITTFLRLNVRNYFALNLVTTLPILGGASPYNAGLLGYKPNGTIVNLVPLDAVAASPVDQLFNIEDYDFISLCVTTGGLASLKMTLIREVKESQPVKKYIDNRVGKNGSISTVNNRFKLTRVAQILTAANTSLPTIYWPSIIRTDNIAGALATYYMYYSTDHGGSGGNSKINLAYSNNLTNWTEYGTIVTALNQIGTVGESETPSVIYDEFFQKYRMYWQTIPDNSGLGYAQSTQISESTDGINWTWVKVALNIPLNSITGNGHNGYFDVLKYSNSYIATHLMGGTDQSYLSRSYSYDGLNWFTSPFVVTAERHGSFPDASGAAGVGNFSEVAHFRYNGRNYAVSRLGTNVGGASGTDPKVVNLGVVELCDDHVTIMGKGELVKEMNEPNETNDIRSIRAFQDSDGTMYIIYNCNDRFFLSRLEFNF